MASSITHAVRRLEALGVRFRLREGALYWGMRPGTLSDADRRDVERLVGEHREELTALLTAQPATNDGKADGSAHALPADCLAPVICPVLGPCDRACAGQPCRLADAMKQAA
jgi:hypothetical protein